MTGIKKEDIFSVSDVNRIVKGVIEQNLPTLWVEGEIANYTSHSSGHIYFSLKDKLSSIRCAFFRQYNIDSRFYPKDGDKVLCFGKIDVYEKTGTYQLLVRQILAAGTGELQIQFNLLKEKLTKEGLFDTVHKKAIPEYPESVGIITSPTGAAFQDIKNVLIRRYPCRIYLYPAAVQGDNAVPELIAGLKYFNETKPVDTIIIGRGGGSQEDLFCFNDEGLARAIFNSSIPVISAVGHEIDFTIADFTADLRAPTPSAAAELAVPNRQDLLIKIRNYRKQLNSKTGSQLLSLKSIIRTAEKTLYQKHPKSILFQHQQQLDESITRLSEKLRKTADLRIKADQSREKLKYLVQKRGFEQINKGRIDLDIRKRRLAEAAENHSRETRKEFTEVRNHLKRLSPYEALKRGYGIIRQEKRILNSVQRINLKQSLEIIMQDGSCQCSVEKISKK